MNMFSSSSYTHLLAVFVSSHSVHMGTKHAWICFCCLCSDYNWLDPWNTLQSAVFSSQGAAPQHLPLPIKHSKTSPSTQMANRPPKRKPGVLFNLTCSNCGEHNNGETLQTRHRMKDTTRAVVASRFFSSRQRKRSQRLSTSDATERVRISPHT